MKDKSKPTIKSEYRFAKFLLVFWIVVLLIPIGIYTSNIIRTHNYIPVKAMCISRTYSRTSYSRNNHTIYYNCNLEFTIDGRTEHAITENSHIREGEIVDIKVNPNNHQDIYVEVNYAIVLLALVFFAAIVSFCFKHFVATREKYKMSITNNPVNNINTYDYNRAEGLGFMQQNANGAYTNTNDNDNPFGK